MKSLFNIYKSHAVQLSDEVYQVGFETPTSNEPEQNETAMPSPMITVGDVYEQVRKEAIEEAQITVNSILLKTEQDRQQILHTARQQADEMAKHAYSEAYKKGYEQGLSDGFMTKTGEIQGCIDSLISKIAEIEGAQSGFAAQYETDLKWVAIEIASKVLTTRIEQDDLVLKELVKTAVDSVKNAEWIRIELSQECAQLISQLRTEYAQSMNISINATPTPAGTCMVETPSGKIDASVLTQLDNLKDYFLTKPFTL